MRVLLAALALCLALRPAVAEPCRQALVLALDVSGSVNEVEFAQQVSGLADALDAPEVRALILDSGLPPVSLAVFEWSSWNHQHVIQPWVRLTDAAALDGAILRIRAHRKVRAGLKTGLGTALGFAADLLAERSGCWRHTIDVSGDGINNTGIPPDLVYTLPKFKGITVNALVVGEPSAGREDARNVGITQDELLSYFERQIIRGQGAFAMVADGYADYARAMRRKLERELEVPVVVEGPGVTFPPG